MATIVHDKYVVVCQWEGGVKVIIRILHKQIKRILSNT